MTIAAAPSGMRAARAALLALNAPVALLCLFFVAYAVFGLWSPGTAMLWWLFLASPVLLALVLAAARQAWISGRPLLAFGLLLAGPCAAIYWFVFA